MPRLREILNTHATEKEEPALKAELQKFLQTIDNKESKSLRDISKLLSHHEELLGKVFHHLLKKYPRRIDNNSLRRDTLFIYNQYQEQSDFKILDFLLNKSGENLFSTADKIWRHLSNKWHGSEIYKTFEQNNGEKYFLAAQDYIKKDLINLLPRFKLKALIDLSRQIHNAQNPQPYDGFIPGFTINLLRSKESNFSWARVLPSTKANTVAWQEVKKAVEEQVALLWDVQQSIYANDLIEESGSNLSVFKKLH